MSSSLSASQLHTVNMRDPLNRVLGEKSVLVYTMSFFGCILHKEMEQHLPTLFTSLYVGLPLKLLIAITFHKKRTFKPGLTQDQGLYNLHCISTRPGQNIHWIMWLMFRL